MRHPRVHHSRPGRRGTIGLGRIVAHRARRSLLRTGALGLSAIVGFWMVVDPGQVVVEPQPEIPVPEIDGGPRFRSIGAALALAGQP